MVNQIHFCGEWMAQDGIMSLLVPEWTFRNWFSSSHLATVLLSEFLSAHPFLLYIMDFCRHNTKLEHLCFRVVVFSQEIMLIKGEKEKGKVLINMNTFISLNVANSLIKQLPYSISLGLWGVLVNDVLVLCWIQDGLVCMFNKIMPKGNKAMSWNL